MFLQSHLLASEHANRSPSEPKICLKMPPWSPREGPRRAQESPRGGQDGPKTLRRTTGNPRKIIFGAVLGPSWGQLGPSWAQLGHFDSILKATWLPSWPLPALKTTTRPPNSFLAGFRKGSRLKESSKIIDFPSVIEGFCNPTFLPIACQHRPL